MKRRILVTSALPYANGALHFGHMAGAYLPADCYCRFERSRGSDVLYICGSDEYGMAITLSAELAGRSPQEHVDHFFDVNRALFDQFGIKFDHFSRTTTKHHAPVVRKFFADLQEGGYVQKRECDQLYSEDDKRFLADRYVVGSCPRCGFDEARGDECQKCGESYEATDLKNPRSKLTGAPLILKKTEHWFLHFEKFQKELAGFLERRAWRPNVKEFAKRYVEDVRPRAITRDIEWGVPLEGESGKVFYVWFDAPIGYISATCEWAEQSGGDWESYWLDQKTRYVQFIGKDNIPFHAIFFPAMIMGQSKPYKMVDDLVANEFYNLEGKKFSKSDGWTVDLERFFAKFSSDQIRYHLAATAPESGDSDFCWKEFQMRCNAELLGKFGNLVNRVLVFIQNKMGGQAPALADLEEVDLRFQNTLLRLVDQIEEAYKEYRLRKVTKLVMELAQEGNAYFDVKTPWRDPQNGTTLALCLECIKLLALTSAPLMPQTASKIWEMLGVKEVPLWDEAKRMVITQGALPKPGRLFAKVEDEMIEEELASLEKSHEQSVQEPPCDPLKESISIDAFDKVDLRVAIILSAEKVKKSKKLLKLQVDLGFEKRQVVSGISHHYSPEELVGKKIILVANLKPAKLMGIESQGMVLAGSIDKQLELVYIQDLPAGATIA
ncbi:MAG: Methionine--tRNA ligase [Chlamydiales bacterium]|nr:Methionine--tRNA ligase [Chlamydiales bacterium]MCH9635019.1 Methionine--tRNA ligase [Chlamydiales bacterium]MCH9704277.1 methionine--tRNA ligase [Chlamydiota bacterium]